jgi:S1-C subfamily serine protease
VILTYNGKELHSSNDLSIAVAETTAGSTADLKVLRNGQTLFLAFDLS